MNPPGDLVAETMAGPAESVSTHDVPSLKKRYLYKLAANVIGLAVSLATQAVIPRGLGPRTYGDFSFLSGFFNQFVSLFDMGTSIGFYTKVSQRPREFGLVAFYLYFSGLACLLMLLIVAAAQVTTAYTWIWPNLPVLSVYMGACFGMLTWLCQIFNKMADAYGVTVSAESARILQKGLGLALILLLFFAGRLNLTSFFCYHYALLLFLIAAFIWVMEKRGHSLRQGWRLSGDHVRAYAREFYTYSHPLFTYALVGLATVTIERWWLQVFGGGVEQGFYALSFQIGAFCFLVTGAMTPLITREFSIAYGEQDYVKMAALFDRYVPMLYAVVAYFSCFIAVEADKVVYLFAGTQFSAAVPAARIMAFYPIHQTYGQLSGSLFYATGNTRLYRNIGVIFMLIGLPVAYVALAPAEGMGVRAGAVGLAVKMVLLQFVTVNVQLFYNARLLKLSFWKYFGQQLTSVGCLLAASTTSLLLAQALIDSQRIIPAFLLSGVVYTLIAALLACCVPRVFGLTRDDLRTLLRGLREAAGYLHASI